MKRRIKISAADEDYTNRWKEIAKAISKTQWIVYKNVIFLISSLPHLSFLSTADVVKAELLNTETLLALVEAPEPVTVHRSPPALPALTAPECNTYTVTCAWSYKKGMGVIRDSPSLQHTPAAVRVSGWQAGLTVRVRSTFSHGTLLHLNTTESMLPSRTLQFQQRDTTVGRFTVMITINGEPKKGAKSFLTLYGISLYLKKQNFIAKYSLYVYFTTIVFKHRQNNLWSVPGRQTRWRTRLNSQERYIHRD